MCSWWGKAGGAILGGIVGGPIGAAIGAALGAAVDSELEQEQQGGSSFNCPHCGTGVLLPHPGTFYCPKCKKDMFFTICPYCTTQLIVGTPGVYSCANCHRDVVFGIKQLDTSSLPSNSFAGLVFPCPHCSEGLNLPHSGAFSCYKCGNTLLAAACAKCGTGFVVPWAGEYNCPSCCFSQPVGSNDNSGDFSPEVEEQLLLIGSYFSLAGMLCAIDGSLSVSGVKVASAEIDSCDSGELKDFVLELFHEGAKRPHEYREQIATLKGARLPESFALELIGFLLRVANADGDLSSNERAFVEDTRIALSVPLDSYKQLVLEICPQEYISECYSILGLSPSVSLDEVKRRYRELALKFHPDKLAGKDLDDEFSKFAQEKMTRINEAYSHIMKARTQ